MDIPTIASNLLRAFLLPPASLFLMLFVGRLLHRRWPRAGRLCTRASLIAFFILCTPVGANLLVTPLESLTVPLAPSNTKNAQAIVVLAAGRLDNAPEYAGTDIPDYIALARLRYGAHLQHQTSLPLLVSGGNRAHTAPFNSKAADMANALRNDFLTPVTWVEEMSETTADNARLSAVMLKAANIHRILLVTDAMHMARAERVFAQTGLEVIVAPTMFFRLKSYDVGTLVPSAEGLRRSYYAMYEWIGLAWYGMRKAFVQLS